MAVETHSNESVPRYEFRLFGPDLGEQARKLAAAMNESGTSRNCSLYVVWKAGEGINVKLDDRALDIKRLIRVTRGFEQWRPDDERGFPLDPAGIEGLPGLRQGGVIDAATFVRRCRNTGCALVHVIKSRRHFGKDSLLGEVCELVVNGCHAESIAIESTDVARLEELCLRLGFDARRNTSYPGMLKQLTSMALLPVDSPHRAYPFG